MNLISIIVPVYNVDKYLYDCINSIVNQTYSNLEIILVDDGSTDKSAAICDEFSNKDSRIKVIHKKNQGVAIARNVGLDAAHGEYIGFVDSDDVIKVDMYEFLLNNLLDNDTDISICGIEKVDENLKTLSFMNPDTSFNKVFSKNDAMDSLCENRVINFSFVDKIFKRDLFKNLRFRENILFEDMDLMYKIIDRADKIFYSSNPKYFYRIHFGSIIHKDFSIKRLDSIYVYKEFLVFIKNSYPNLLDKAKCYFLELCFINLFEILESKSKKFNNEKNKLIVTIKKVYKDVKSSIYFNKKLKLKVFLLNINAKLYLYFYKLFLTFKNTKLRRS